MKFETMYPPKGGEPIGVHPTKVQEMLDKGYTKEQNSAKSVSKKTEKIASSES